MTTKTSIWNPASVQEALDMSNLLSNGKPMDLLQLHAAFGHHFGGDLGLTMTQGYVLKGKPTLNADAMAGICRRSGLCRYLRITEWSAEVCSLEMARTDEPDEIVHTYSFTIEMAQQQGLTRNRNWQQMPQQMLRARALTLGLRATFPDAVSGVYSADEIADNTSMSDHERDVITAHALGTDLPSRPPQSQRAPQQSQRAPQQSEPPQSQPPQSQPEPNRLYDWSSDDALTKACRSWGVNLEDAVAFISETVESPTSLTPQQREALFYSRCAPHALMDNSISQHWFNGSMREVEPIHRALWDQLPLTKFLSVQHLGPRLPCGAFMETLKLSEMIKDKARRDIALDVLRKMNPMDWTAFDYVQSILDDDMEMGSAS